MSAAFPRHARLLLPAEYDRVFAAGKRFSGPNVTLVAARCNVVGKLSAGTTPAPAGKAPKAPQLSRSSNAKLGLALAKKQIKRAHERNRVKRHVREQFRQHRLALFGVEVVAMARNPAQKMTNAALKSEIDRLIQRMVEHFMPAVTPSSVAHAPTQLRENP
jgi:ribonuclease P protein component